MRWLNAREWLEHERLTGLPHADFAAEALGVLESEDTVAQVMYDLDQPDDLFVTVRALRDFRDVVLTVLTDAGVIDDDVPANRVGGLLRMFLPS